MKSKRLIVVAVGLIALLSVELTCIFAVKLSLKALGYQEGNKALQLLVNDAVFVVEIERVT